MDQNAVIKELNLQTGQLRSEIEKEKDENQRLRNGLNSNTDSLLRLQA